MSVNKIILLGNVGRDPDVRYVESRCLAAFPLATSDPPYVNDKGVQIAERTEWHNIVMWGAQAEQAERYIRKGMKLYIEGKMRYRTWEDRTAIKRTVSEVYVDHFEILSAPKSNS